MLDLVKSRVSLKKVGNKKAGLDCESIVDKVENALSSNVVIAKNKSKNIF